MPDVSAKLSKPNTPGQQEKEQTNNQTNKAATDIGLLHKSALKWKVQ